MSTKNRTNNIFDILGSINNKNSSFYDELEENQQKDIHPFVIMRWMSGSSDKRQIYMLNEVVNPYVFTLGNHKQLLINLLTICGPGSFRKYKWVKPPNKNKGNTPTIIKLVSEYFDYSSKTARESLPMLTRDDILSYSEQLGYDSEQLRNIIKELKLLDK